MLLPSGSSAQVAELRSLLRSSHRVRPKCEVLTVTHGRVTDLSRWVVDGQVEIDCLDPLRRPTRSATVTLLDPDRRSRLTGGSNADGSIALDRMIRLSREYWLPSARVWLPVPIFTGPITDVTPHGDTIEVEAQGKEYWALQPIWSSLSWRAGTKRTQVIRDLMRWRAGETRFSIPPAWGAKLGRTLSTARKIDDEKATVWALVRGQARALGADVFYDGAGTLRLRRRPVLPVWTINADDISGDIERSERRSEIKNVVMVTGGVARAGAARGGQRDSAGGGASSAVWTPPAPTVTRSIRPPHPWAPERLGRPSAPHRKVEKVEDSDLLTQAAVNAVAARMIRAQQTGSLEVKATALPVPMVEEWDLLAIRASGLSRTRLHKATIPLVDGLMDIGSIRSYTPRRVR